MLKTHVLFHYILLLPVMSVWWESVTVCCWECLPNFTFNGIM